MSESPPEVLVAGETLVDLIPTGEGGLAEIDGFAHRPGGAPANVAVGLEALETPTRFWTRLGTDPFGDYLSDVLSRNAIDTDDFERIPDGTTTLAVVTPASDGDDRRFDFYGSTDVTFGFDRERIPEAALAECSWVHVGGVALTHPRGREAMLELAARARDHDCTVSFDVNLRPTLVSPGSEADVGSAIRQLIGTSDVVFCSPSDLELFDPEAVRDAERSFDGTTGAALRTGNRIAERLLEQGPHTAVVTLGADGAVVASSSAAPWGRTRLRHPGFDVTVTDTTGAGDAFAAATIAQSVGGQSDVEHLLEFASATAALTVTGIGGLSSIPSRTDVEAFLRRER